MGAEFTKVKGNEKHNVDIAYDYRFFFDYMNDNIHEDCIQYLQPYKIDPNENDQNVLIKYFNKAANEDLNKYSKSKNINPSLRCYCLDGLAIRYLIDKKAASNVSGDVKDKKYESTDEPKFETNNPTELLMVDTIKSLLMDNNKVSLAEGLFGMNVVYQLPFHHILQYLSSNINHHIQQYIFTNYNIIPKQNNQSFVDKMNEISNMDDGNIKQEQKIETDNNNNKYKINYEMIFELLENNALRNQCKKNYELLNEMMMYHEQESNQKGLFLKYIPLITMYKNTDDVMFIESLLQQGPSQKSWFAAMKSVEYFPHQTFWDYLMHFFKKIYAHISLVNGETVPVNLKQALEDKKHEQHDHNCGNCGDEDGEEEKDDIKKDNEEKIDRQLLVEGVAEGDNKHEADDEYVQDNNENKMDYQTLIDESQYYDISTQMRFIKTLCVFSVADVFKYNEKVCASIHHLLDIPKANTNNGYYEDNMSYLLQCIPLHISMKSVIFRIWEVYGVCDWRYLNVLIYEPCLSKLAFQRFLLGTNKKIGKDSNILKIAGESGILKNIYSFLKDDIFIKSMKLLMNYDNIIWWSSINEESKYIMNTLRCIENLFNVLIRMNNSSRFVLYEKFKEKHNSRIIEKYIIPKFDSVLVQK